jgi:hypothetical protein
VSPAEKKTLLDALDAAEKEACNRADALRLSLEVEIIIHRFAARIREAMKGIDTTDLPPPV